MEKPQLKPLLEERMKKLLGKDFRNYLEILETEPPKSIRCNTLKISPEKLRKRLEEKRWKIVQPFKEFPEIMIVEGKFEIEDKSGKESNKDSPNSIENLSVNSYSVERSEKVGRETNTSRERSERKLEPLSPGELGRSLEHVLGYYYVQEIASMLPIIALEPKSNETVLDLCSSPGSKTTQMASKMENTGTIIANEVTLGRVKILASNLERCGVSNAIITKKEGASLCRNLKNLGFSFDKILIDAPCSGEGTLRTSKMTYKMWNIHTVRKLSKIQKNLILNAFEILKPGGFIVYSTCTHAPEENEGVLSFIKENLGEKVKIEKVNLPVKCRPGVCEWSGVSFDKDVSLACRIYPQDNDTEGFFISKIKKIE